MTPAQELVEQSFRDLAAWLAIHDPDGELSETEQCAAYGKWHDDHPEA